MLLAVMASDQPLPRLWLACLRLDGRAAEPDRSASRAGGNNELEWTGGRL
jgi:hypothetical protein